MVSASKPRIRTLLRNGWRRRCPCIATMRERTGLALALDYLVRVYLPDPSDEIHGGRGYAS